MPARRRDGAPVPLPALPPPTEATLPTPAPPRCVPRSPVPPPVDWERFVFRDPRPMIHAVHVAQAPPPSTPHPSTGHVTADYIVNQERTNSILEQRQLQPWAEAGALIDDPEAAKG